MSAQTRAACWLARRNGRTIARTDAENAGVSSCLSFHKPLQSCAAYRVARPPSERQKSAHGARLRLPP
jgi:hypothetical protein